MPLYILNAAGDPHNGELIQTKATDIEVEEYLENWLERSPTVLFENAPILWIGRQASATTARTTLFPDLLGLDAEGNIVIVEIKRGPTPRDVIAQVLEYAAWAANLSDQTIEQLASAYWKGRQDGTTLGDAFRETFLAGDETETIPPLNQNQILFIVAEEIHPRVEEVARYLRERGHLDVRCVAFSVFRATSGEVLVSVDTIVGEEAISTTSRRSGGVTWSGGDKSASDVIYETVIQLLQQPGKETFTPSEVYHEILKTYPNFNKGTNGDQIIADCANHPSRKHYGGQHPDYYFRVERGVYRLYNPQQDGLWDQEGNPIQTV